MSSFTDGQSKNSNISCGHLVNFGILKLTYVFFKYCKFANEIRLKEIEVENEN